MLREIREESRLFEEAGYVMSQEEGGHGIDDGEELIPTKQSKMALTHVSFTGLFITSRTIPSNNLLCATMKYKGGDGGPEMVLLSVQSFHTIQALLVHLRLPHLVHSYPSASWLGQCTSRSAQRSSSNEINLIDDAKRDMNKHAFRIFRTKLCFLS